MNQQTITRAAVRSLTRFVLHARTSIAAAVAAAVFVHLSAQPVPLSVERRGDLLRVSAPQLHFVSGTPLARLRDGRPVTYALTLSLEVQRGAPHRARITRQVVVSYDLWEERFAVTQVGAPGAAASHLTAAAAEAWCLDLLALPVPPSLGDRTLVLKLECSVRDGDDRRADTATAATLTGLIDLLSRKSRAAPPRWEALSLPLRLADLKDKASR